MSATVIFGAPFICQALASGNIELCQFSSSPVRTHHLENTQRNPLAPRGAQARRLCGKKVAVAGVGPAGMSLGLEVRQAGEMKQSPGKVVSPWSLEGCPSVRWPCMGSQQWEADGPFHPAGVGWSVTAPSWDSGTRFPGLAGRPVNLTLVNVLEVCSSSKGTARRPDMGCPCPGRGPEWWDCRQRQKSGSLQPPQEAQLGWEVVGMAPS